MNKKWKKNENRKRTLMLTYSKQLTATLNREIWLCTLSLARKNQSNNPMHRVSGRTRYHPLYRTKPCKKIAHSPDCHMILLAKENKDQFTALYLFT